MLDGMTSQNWFWPIKDSKIAGPNKVSIIMATYQRQHIIQRAVDSVIAQSYTNWELLVMDNEPGSTYTFSDPRIKYFQCSDEISAAYARNKGVEFATGELICFLDDDDVIASDYLEILTAPFTNPIVKATCCYVYLEPPDIAPHDFCTPSTIIRRELATPTWKKSFGHDIDYFSRIVYALPTDAYVHVGKPLVSTSMNPIGGTRSGKF